MAMLEVRWITLNPQNPILVIKAPYITRLLLQLRHCNPLDSLLPPPEPFVQDTTSNPKFQNSPAMKSGIKTNFDVSNSRVQTQTFIEAL